MRLPWKRIRDEPPYRKEPHVLNFLSETESVLVQRVPGGFMLIWICDQDGTSVRIGMPDEQARYLIGKLEEHL